MVLVEKTMKVSAEETHGHGNIRKEGENLHRGEMLRGGLLE